ncbi:MAG: peptidylprolyl isomerase [Nitrospinota bacterium]
MIRYFYNIKCRNSKFTIIIFVVSVVISLLVSSHARCEIVDRVAAKVRGDIITLSEVRERTLLVKEKIRPEMNKDIKIKDIERMVIDMIIAERLQLDYAKKIGIEVTDEDIYTAIKDIKEKNSLTDKMLETLLEKDGQTIDNYRARIREQLILSKVVDYEVKSRIRIDDNEIKGYYEEHLNSFLMPEEVNIRHILFLCNEDTSREEEERIREKALSVLKRVREDEDFIELVKIYSEDPSASSGGDLGFFKKGTMLAPLEKAAFSLKVGEVSDQVRTKYGFHIIRVEGKKESAPRSIDEVREGIRNRIFAEKIKKRYDNWIADLKDVSYIEILMPMESEKGEFNDRNKRKEKVK